MEFTRTGGGLLVPEGSQEAAVDAALRRHDPDLRLVPQDSDVYGRRIYKVYHYNGPDTPADLVCVWWDQNHEPLPLSSSLVDYVQMLDKNTVDRGPTLEEQEARVREQKRKDAREEMRPIVEEFAKKLDGKKTVLLPRSQSLRRARDKERARQKNPEYRP